MAITTNSSISVKPRRSSEREIRDARFLSIEEAPGRFWDKMITHIPYAIPPQTLHPRRAPTLSPDSCTTKKAGLPGFFPATGVAKLDKDRLISW